MIWEYNDLVGAPREEDLQREDCPYCRLRMDILLQPAKLGHTEIPSSAPNEIIRACAVCGYWTHSYQTHSIMLDPDTGRTTGWSLYGAEAELRRLNLCDLSTGIDEVRRFLAARYAARFELHPRLFELTVASVFRDLGYEAEATAYSSDGGIDVILRSANGDTAGVQVKRVQARIEVEQIRSLAGALILAGHTKGIFVTTSAFRSGAITAATRLKEKALPVELVDGPRFFDALRLTMREAYADYMEWYELYGGLQLSPIYEDED